MDRCAVGAAGPSAAPELGVGVSSRPLGSHRWENSLQSNIYLWPRTRLCSPSAQLMAAISFVSTEQPPCQPFIRSSVKGIKAPSLPDFFFLNSPAVAR